jgi:hypothetical protein
MDRIRGIGHQHHIAGRSNGLRHIGEALFRAKGRDDLRIGVQLHAKATRVIIGLSPAQARNALGGGIAIHPRLGHGLDQLGFDVSGRIKVGIAHAKIDNIGTGVTGLGLQTVDLLENVRRQALHTMKVRH